jgi:hypothetical protein
VTVGNGLFNGISIQIRLGNYFRCKRGRPAWRLMDYLENISTKTEKEMEMKY